MKKLFAALVLALLVLAFQFQPAAAQTPLTWGVPVAGTLEIGGDSAAYEINVTAGQHLFVLLDGADNINQYVLYLRYNAIPTPTQYDARSRPEDEFADQAVEIASTRAGRYYILVYSEIEGGDFTVTAHNSATLPALTLGAPAAGALDDDFDLAYYQVTLTAGQHFFAILDAADNANTYSLYVRRGALPNLDTFDAEGQLSDADQAAEIASATAGTYYILVRSLNGGGSFTLAAHTNATLPALTPGTPVSGSLQGVNDVKFYRVNASAGQRLSVILDGSDNTASYGLYLNFGALPDQLTYEAAGDMPDSDQAAEIASATAGSYYVMLLSLSGGGEYSLVAHTNATFPALTLGAPRADTLQDTGDVRWYQFSASAGQHLFFLLDAAAAAAEYDLYVRYDALPSLFDSDVEGILPDGDQAAELDPAQAGRYYVMVRSAGGGGDFTLTAHTPSTFPTLTLGSAQAGVLPDSLDTRFYRVNLPAGEHFMALLESANDSNRYELYLRAGALPSLLEYDAVGALPDADQAAEIAVTQPGSYYILLRSAAGGGAYTLTAHTTATFPALTRGIAQAGALAAPGDVRFFQVPAAAADHLFVLLDAAQNLDACSLSIRFGALPTLTEYDRSGALPNADQALEIASAQSGFYYVMLRAVAGSGGDFTLTAHDPATFPTLIPGDFTQNVLQGAGDVKFYKLALPDSGQYFVHLDAAVNAAQNTLLLNPGSLPTLDTYSMRGEYPGGDQVIELFGAAPGEMYLLLRADAAGGDYLLELRVPATLPSLSIGLAFGSALQGPGDLKLFRLDVPPDQAVKVTLDGEDPGRFSLYLRSGRLPTLTVYDQLADLPQPDQEIIVPSTGGGTYYLLVRSTVGGGAISLRAETTVVLDKKFFFPLLISAVNPPP